MCYADGDILLVVDQMCCADGDILLILIDVFQMFRSKCFSRDSS